MGIHLDSSIRFTFTSAITEVTYRVAIERLSVIALVLVTACTSAGVSDSALPSEPPLETEADDEPTSNGPTTTTTTPIESSAPVTYPPAPDAPTGPLDPRTEEGLERLLAGIFSDEFEPQHLREVVAGGDVRAAWILADLLRFFQRGDPRDHLVTAFRELTGVDGSGSGEIDFVWAFDHLIAWDLPAWDGYPEMKGSIYPRIDQRWQIFFDQDQGVDWRLVTWGGVLADDRPLGDNGPCNCIPSLDNPATTEAADGGWYDDDRVVFGLIVNGEALALPKNQMEIHEMVNTTLGGRDIGVPYCTLCGSAQAYYTDNVSGFERLVLRTSGLLSRSNKMMYDLTTGSLIDTFTGRAISGPLGEAGVVLEQVTVVASLWGDWKAARPNTRILAEDGGVGRSYADDPLRGRDDAGPIFPIGDVDPRLPVQEDVIGVVAPDGTPIAFPVDAITAALSSDDEVEFEGLIVRQTDAIRIYAPDGEELVSHQAFWFAWSQFHPQSLVWGQSGL